MKYQEMQPRQAHNFLCTPPFDQEADSVSGDHLINSRRFCQVSFFFFPTLPPWEKVCGCWSGTTTATGQYCIGWNDGFLIGLDVSQCVLFKPAGLMHDRPTDSSCCAGVSLGETIWLWICHVSVKPFSFAGISWCGTHTYGFFYHCCLKGCTILKGKLLGNISLKQGCIGNWNAWVHDRQRTHSTFWDMCWSSVVSCELVLFPSDFGNVKVRLSHIGGICDRIEVLGIPPQRCLYSALGFASKQGLGC